MLLSLVYVFANQCILSPQTIGLTRTSLKLYITRYPSLVLNIFQSPVKSSKSVIIKYLGISEEEYASSLRKLMAQTNGKAGSFFRGSFFFIAAYLKTDLGLSSQDVKNLFIHYPTLFTFSLTHISERVSELLGNNNGYSLEQVRRLLNRNGRYIFYESLHFQALRRFFVDELGLSQQQFCAVTSKEPRLISASLSNTLSKKRDHLLSTWNLCDEDIGRIVLFAPGVLTTPSATSMSLYIYLSQGLNMPKEVIRAFILKQPGFLRVNIRTLQPKIDLFVLMQMLSFGLIFSSQKDDISVFLSNNSTEESELDTIETLVKMYQCIGREVLEQNGLVLTFSFERIIDRLNRAMPIVLEMLTGVDHRSAVNRMMRLQESISFNDISSRKLKPQSPHQIAGTTDIIQAVKSFILVIGLESARRLSHEFQEDGESMLKGRLPIPSQYVSH